MNRRGVSMVELIIGFFIVAVAMLVLFSVFSGSYKSSVMTRNRIGANYLTNSFFEEGLAHRYGDKAPEAWPVPVVGVPDYTDPPGEWEQGPMPATQRLEVVVDGRPQQMVYYRQLYLANGSLVGDGSGENWDEMTLVISWKEKGDEENPGGIKTVTSKLLVWRQNAIK